MSRSPSRTKLARKGTMEQTIADAQHFLAAGTYDAEEDTNAPLSPPTAPPSLGKRKIHPVTKYEEPPSPKRSRSKSPPRKVAKTAKTRTVRSISPSKQSKTKSKIRKPTPACKPQGKRVPKPPSALGVPIIWEFQSDKPAFGVHVSRDRCWMSNDDGNMYGFTLDGNMERHIKLPSGIKSVVSDMNMWLYAGCDNGVVYDLSHESEPRQAYQFQDFEVDNDIIHTLDTVEEEDTHNDMLSYVQEKQPIKRRHIVFTIDKSSSMSGGRMQEVAKNLRMIYDHHLRDGDIISLITFATKVSVAFERVERGKNDEKLREFIYSPSFTSCSGCTAFFDALGASWNQCNGEAGEEEQWIFALTDGEDNESRAFSQASLCKIAKENKANLVCIFVADSTTSSYHQSLTELCENTENGLFIHATENGTSGDITAAFKHIAQLLSSNIMWMDIRDGLLTVSDNTGRVAACSIEGNPLWIQKSSGTCGWMVRSDFEGIYHGHSNGVTKYSTVDGTVLWNSLLNKRVMFGWMDKTCKMLFVGAGTAIYQISCADGKIENSFDCDSCVVSTAASFGSEYIYGADDKGQVYCFSKGDQKRLWKLNTDRGVALSMHYSDNRLYVVTVLGSLICIDVNLDNLKKNLSADRPLVPKQASIPAGLAVTLPDSRIEEVTDVGDGIVIEVYQEFSDADLLLVAKHIHNPESAFFTLHGKEYSVEKHANGCRCVKINGVTWIEQNKKKSSKYGERAAKGDHIMWILNKGKWGLVVNQEVQHNGSRLLARPAPNDKGFDINKLVQFPKDLRTQGIHFVAEQLVASESGTFYRTQGKLQKLIK